MKTLDESLTIAIEMICRKVPIKELGTVAMDQHAARLLGTAERWEEIAREARGHEEMRGVLAMYISVCNTPMEAMFNAFMLGLSTGIHMERSETGGIQE